MGVIPPYSLSFYLTLNDSYSQSDLLTMKFFTTVLIAASALCATASASPLEVRTNDDKTPYWGDNALRPLGCVKDAFYLEPSKCDLSSYHKQYDDHEYKLLIIVVDDDDKKAEEWKKAEEEKKKKADEEKKKAEEEKKKKKAEEEKKKAEHWS